MKQGLFYDFSNYGSYDQLTDDGLTQWHAAFLSLGKQLDECAAKYRRFCQKYKQKPKPEKRYSWGSRLLSGVLKAREKKKHSPGQLTLPWANWEPMNAEIHEVAEKFVLANGFPQRLR